jgi:hypothetical protein
MSQQFKGLLLVIPSNARTHAQSDAHTKGTPAKQNTHTGKQTSAPRQAPAKAHTDTHTQTQKETHTRAHAHTV